MIKRCAKDVIEQQGQTHCPNFEACDLRKYGRLKMWLPGFAISPFFQRYLKAKTYLKVPIQMVIALYNMGKLVTLQPSG